MMAIQVNSPSVIIKNLVKKINAAIALYLPLVGGILTGSLTITSSGSSYFSSEVDITSNGVSSFSSNVGFGGLTSPTAQVNTAAGTTSVAPIKMTSGSLLTTAVTGSQEFYSGVAYFTPVDSSRAVIPLRHYICNSVAYTLTNGTSEQSIFGKSVSLAASTTYRFRALYNIGTGSTSHTTATGFSLTNSLSSCNYFAQLISAALNTISTSISSVMVASASAKVLNATSATVTTVIRLEGVIRTNLATTLTPQITFSAAPGTTCQLYADSFFEIEPIGISTDTSCGAWS
jgi:hypothetical protein